MGEVAVANGRQSQEKDPTFLKFGICNVTQRSHGVDPPIIPHYNFGKCSTPFSHSYKLKRFSFALINWAILYFQERKIGRFFFFLFCKFVS